MTAGEFSQTHGALYTVLDAAKHLHVNPETVRRWIRKGSIQYFPNGGGIGYRIPECEIHRLNKEAKLECNEQSEVGHGDYENEDKAHIANEQCEITIEAVKVKEVLDTATPIQAQEEDDADPRDAIINSISDRLHKLNDDDFKQVNDILEVLLRKVI